MAPSSSSFSVSTSIGKTPTIKQQARALDSDVLFVLDADTVLESDNYIERTVQDLYQARRHRQRLRDASCRCGSGIGGPRTSRPRCRRSSRPSHLTEPAAPKTLASQTRVGAHQHLPRGALPLPAALRLSAGRWRSSERCATRWAARWRTAASISRRSSTPWSRSLGDDLTNSEDIFIGLAMLNEGYRNIQVPDVCARTVEPEVQRLPKQVYLWSSAFLQSAFYFDALLKSPFKALKRLRCAVARGGGSGGACSRLSHRQDPSRTQA